MSIEVRPAEIADARAIAEVHVRGWRETYAHLVPAEKLARMSVDQRELRWNEILPLADANVWVASDDGQIIGFAGASAGRDADSPRPLELQSIYVLASHYGSGAGQQLLDASIGDSPAFVWVASDNPRARAFYARNRFVPDGSVDIHSLLGTPVEAVRLVR